MTITTIILTTVGLVIFELVSSLDNAIINAEVLGTMGARARRWFLTWGFFIAVFVVRGLTPWLLVWLAMPQLGVWGSLTASFSGDASVAAAVAAAAPLVLSAGGIFLVLLFLHWLFLEKKEFGLPGEKFFSLAGGWFFTIASFLLTFLVYFAIQKNPQLALAITVGSSAFFLTHGFKEQAEKVESELASSGRSDLAKLMYLEAIDATFSVDGVVGAFAFTFSVPLILLGNGIGAVLLRKWTIGNIERIKKYPYLKNGALYSAGVLGAVMLVESFGVHVPDYFAPLSTIAIVGYFFWLSVRRARQTA